MVTWIVLALVVLALLVLALTGLAVLGRLSALQRAVRRLQLRQAEALRLQAGAAGLAETVAGLQQRAELAQEQVAAIRGEHPAPAALLER